MLTARQLKLLREHNQAEAAMPGLGVFLSSSERAQLAFIQDLDDGNAKKLLNALIDLAAQSDTRTIPCVVVQKLYEKCDAAEYRESAQDGDDRTSLTPKKLAEVRAESRRLAMVQSDAEFDELHRAQWNQDTQEVWNLAQTLQSE